MNEINENQNQNQTTIFDSIAPHPEPVVIGELLTEIEAVIKNHVVLSDAAATALAVWVLHTYVYEHRDTVAYVAIESPEKRCGKTTLLTVLAAMANKPLIASNVTVGALFCAIDMCSPTLFIDEADTFLAGNGTMRGVINSGNTWRTAYVLRMSKSKSNQNRARQQAEPAEVAHAQNGNSSSAHNSNSPLKRYSCWCPKVIAMIGKVPDTIADRSIVVHMTRKLTTEIRAPLSELNPAVIKSKCARFALDAGQKVRHFEKIHGEGLNDRAADTFDPLYVIARLAGVQWEEKLHAAALAIFSQMAPKSSAAELLLDVYSVFLSTGRKQIFTRALVESLRSDESCITSAALKYSTIDELRIVQLLRPYGIKTSPCRIGSKVARGYRADDFIEALQRYVPKAELEARVQESNQQDKLWEDAEKFAESIRVPDCLADDEEDEAPRRRKGR